jgi:hypothetical protein
MRGMVQSFLKIVEKKIALAWLAQWILTRRHSLTDTFFNGKQNISTKCRHAHVTYLKP